VLAQRENAVPSGRRELDPWRPYAFLSEEERSASGEIVPVATVFLTNRECPWRCLMCDLWRNTLQETVPAGAIPAQVAYALARLAPAQQIKLYNSGSFFDRRAIPPEDHAAIATRLDGFERVIVECHPALVGDDCLRFRDLLKGKLEVAMGLETVHPDVLPHLNKQISTAGPRQLCSFLPAPGMVRWRRWRRRAPSPHPAWRRWKRRSATASAWRAAASSPTSGTWSGSRRARIVFPRGRSGCIGRTCNRFSCLRYHAEAVRGLVDRTYDLAVVGSGFAGSLLAMIARRLGHDVVLLERSRHPRFAVGESSTPLANLLLEELASRYDLPGVRDLAKWGSWQRTHPEIACGLKRGFSFYHHGFDRPFTANPDRTDQLLVAASPHEGIADTHWYRPEFDQFLVAEARDAGVAYLDEVVLGAPTWLGDRVVLSGSRRGTPASVQARFVVDATGPRGFLHRALHLPEVSFPSARPSSTRRAFLFAAAQSSGSSGRCCRQPPGSRIPCCRPGFRWRCWACCVWPHVSSRGRRGLLSKSVCIRTRRRPGKSYLPLNA